jgi:hypothetical protein
LTTAVDFIRLESKLQFIVELVTKAHGIAVTFLLIVHMQATAPHARRTLIGAPCQDVGVFLGIVLAALAVTASNAVIVIVERD